MHKLDEKLKKNKVGISLLAMSETSISIIFMIYESIYNGTATYPKKPSLYTKNKYTMRVKHMYMNE